MFVGSEKLRVEFPIRHNYLSCPVYKSITSIPGAVLEKAEDYMVSETMSCNRIEIYNFGFRY